MMQIAAYEELLLVACGCRNHKIYLAHLWFMCSLERGNSSTAQYGENKKNSYLHFQKLTVVPKREFLKINASVELVSRSLLIWEF